MKHRVRALIRFIRQTRAVSALEYAILVGIIAVAVGAALVTFGDNIETALKNVGNQIKAVKVDSIKTK